MNACVKVIDNCLDCNSCTVDRILTADSWDHEEGAYCKEVLKNGKPRFIVSDDWDLRKWSKVPDWCPNLLKDYLGNLLDKAGVATVKKFDEKLDNLLKDLDDDYTKVIRTLIRMGFAYQQVAFERDVAIEQLKNLGIEFGEDTTKYKVVR
ncbi:MAG TPA: hypothetical protein DCW90_22860 [Lachnospiraceae bacterium]|nr:hypothetical protein [Lachnospiraceae bacterium]